MTEHLDIISIFCHVYLDEADSTQETGAEQKLFKNHVNQLFNTAFQHIGQTNRIILISDHGAAIAYNGPPDDAMHMATEMLNGILIDNKQGKATLSASVGVHLHSVEVVNDFTEQPNMIGNGICTARRMAAKAKPNQIAVSSAYYENISLYNQSLATVFYSDFDKHEQHVLQYQSYLAASIKDEPTDITPLHLDQPFTLPAAQPSLVLSKFPSPSPMQYALASLLIIALFLSVKLIKAPLPTEMIKASPVKASLEKSKKTPSFKSKTSEPKILEPITSEPKTLSSTDYTNDADNQLTPANKLNTALEKNQVKQKPKINPDANVGTNANSNPNPDAKPDAKPVVKADVKPKAKSQSKPEAKKNNTKEILSWEMLKKSFKQGKKLECTQAEKAMNQCRD